MAGGSVERAVRHYGEDAGARRGFQHSVARPDHGGLHGGVGERQGRGELLEPDLFLGSACVGGFERRQAFEHREHGGGALRAGTGLAAHGGAVPLDE